VSSGLVKHMMTPQAAPETGQLRLMRFVWMGLCCSLGLGVLLIRPIVDLLGNWGALAVLLLTIATPLHGWIYFRKKNRADDDFVLERAE
jgi:hypothetical protein